MHVEFLVPDLGYTAAAKQVLLIAPALGRTDSVDAVGTVFPLTRAGRAGPFAGLLRADGVMVLESSARSAVRWLGLRYVVPAPGRGLVHAFGLPALRRLWAGTVGARRPPILLSLTGREQLRWLDRHCLRIVSRVLVHHSHAADALIRQGIPSGRISVIPPAVGEPPAPPDREAVLGPLGIPPGGPLIVTVGSMPDRLRLLGAVWVFEFIRYPHEDAHMLLIGDGPGRADLEATARGVAPEGSRIHFLGGRADAPALFGLADVVFVPHPTGGVNVALEAMAAGRAVVAADTPDLGAVIRDGQTGRLYAPGDAVAAARAVRQLLLDPAERRQLGEAARAYVRERHQVATVVQMLETVYRDEFTSTRSGLWAE
jgi:glycosyltransferase involved in cell wall biosynthesis